MSFQALKYEKIGKTAVITLSRPDKLNAFTVEMCQELQEALDSADSDTAVRAVIFTGEGRAFCAGMDLATGGNVFGLDETIDPSGPEAERLRDTGGLVTLRIFDMNKPVIGAIKGPAIGIGATMTLAMDARILGESARIGFVFSRLGVSMEACSSWFLPRLIGMEAALDWILSGETRGARAAVEAGYAWTVVPDDDLMEAAFQRVERYTANTSAVSVAVNRRLLWQMAGASHPMLAHRLDSRAMFELSMADGREGVEAFLQRRKPNFTNQVPNGLPCSIDWTARPDFE